MVGEGDEGGGGEVGEDEDEGGLGAVPGKVSVKMRPICCRPVLQTRNPNSTDHHGSRLGYPDSSQLHPGSRCCRLPTP